MSENKTLEITVNPSLLKPTAVYLFAGYFFWPFSLIGLAIEKEDDFIRFHCAQGMAFLFVQIILGILISFFSAIVWLIFPILLLVAAILASIAAYVFLIIALIKAAKGEKYKIPLVGDFADKSMKNWLIHF